jgi:hypothetical protein
MRARVQSEDRPVMDQLPEARTWWCEVTYRLLSGERTAPWIAPERVDQFVSRVAGVSQSHLRNVRMGRSHLSESDLKKLADRLGPYLEFLPISVMSSSFEAGLRDYAFHQRLRREEAQLRARSRRRRGLP